MKILQLQKKFLTQNLADTNILITLLHPHVQREGNSWEASIYEREFICVDLEQDNREFLRIGESGAMKLAFLNIIIMEEGRPLAKKYVHISNRLTVLGKTKYEF